MFINLFARFGGVSAIALATAFVPVHSASAQDAAPAASQSAPQAKALTPGIPAWGITEAELPADPTVTYGVLENGMRYALKRNTQPKEEASMRLIFDVGMRDEQDNEEGAAHFVEHMAFNGSANIPEGELLPMLERLGLAFGADTNAETSPFHTMYKLDLPKLDEETVSAGFTILREMSSELTIAPSAVEAEKGIIVSEYQVRNTPLSRRAVQLQREIMATDRLAERSVAEPEKTRSLTAETLRGFYEGFYRPEKATLVIVGDIDVAAMEKRIIDTFQSWEGKGEARENFDPSIADFDGLRTSVYVEPTVTEVAEMYRLADYKAPTNTLAEYQGNILDSVATIVMANRFQALTGAEDAKVLNGALIKQDLGQAADMYGMVAVAKDGDWNGAVGVAEQEWRRAAQFGFAASEITQAKAAIKNSLETAVAQSNSSSNAGIAYALAMTAVSGSVRQSPEQSLALYNMIADTITPEAALANFRAKWGAGPNYAQVASKTAIENGEAAVAAAIKQSATVAVTAPEEAAAVEFAYTDFGPAGEVVSDERIEALGIRTVTFANGVNLNIKKTDFEPGKVLVRAEIGSGLSTVDGKKGLILLPIVVAGIDDLNKHSAEELSQLLSGRQAGYGYTLDEDAVEITNTTTADDLLFQLQIMTAQITDTAFSDQAQRRWAAAIPLIANNMVSNPQALHGIAQAAVMTGGDPRFGLTDAAVLSDISMADLKEVVGTQYSSGRVDIGIVGDVDEDAAIAAVAQTIGTIARAESEEKTVAPVTFTKDRSVRTLYHAGQADQGMMSVSWPTDDGIDMRDAMVRMMLSEVINLEALRVLREELGATYTPSSVSEASTTFDGVGYISLILPATPSQMEEVSKVVRDLVSGFAKTAPSADAMQRARQPILERYERSDGLNGGWISTVTQAQRHPERTMARAERAKVLASITPEEVLAAAKKYLTAEPIELRVVPQPQEKAAE